ncbi:MAG TPA: hypothetical protein VK625_18160, partial [Flavitalea sp.]|nr:hypothetical protein [Flavitalea sp.]
VNLREDVDNWLVRTTPDALKKGVSGFYVQFYGGDPGTVLTTVVLFFHEQVQLVQTPHYRPILLLIIRERPT